MTHQHRCMQSDESFEPSGTLWAPALERVDGVTISVAPLPDDVYWVIDDVVLAGDTAGGTAITAAAPWPQLDHAGRLLFGDPANRRDSDRWRLDELQMKIDDARRAAGQPAADRPLRIGDAFWVRGVVWPTTTRARPPAPEPPPPPQWSELLDITKPAREAAKIAQYAAVAPTVLPDEAASMELRATPEEIVPPRIPRGPVARPAI